MCCLHLQGAFGIICGIEKCQLCRKIEGLYPVNVISNFKKEEDMKALKGSRCIALLFLTSG